MGKSSLTAWETAGLRRKSRSEESMMTALWDQQFERNCEKVVVSGRLAIIKLCLDMKGRTPEEGDMQEALAGWSRSSTGGSYGIRKTALCRGRKRRDRASREDGALAAASAADAEDASGAEDTGRTPAMLPRTGAFDLAFAEDPLSRGALRRRVGQGGMDKIAEIAV